MVWANAYTEYMPVVYNAGCCWVLSRNDKNRAKIIVNPIKQMVSVQKPLSRINILITHINFGGAVLQRNNQRKCKNDCKPYKTKGFCTKNNEQKKYNNNAHKFWWYGESSNLVNRSKCKHWFNNNAHKFGWWYNVMKQLIFNRLAASLKKPVNRLIGLNENTDLIITPINLVVIKPYKTKGSWKKKEKQIPKKKAAI